MHERGKRITYDKSCLSGSRTCLVLAVRLVVPALCRHPTCYVVLVLLIQDVRAQRQRQRHVAAVLDLDPDLEAWGQSPAAAKENICC